MAISCTSISAVWRPQGAPFGVFSQQVFKVKIRPAMFATDRICSVWSFRPVYSARSHLKIQAVRVSVKCILLTTILQSFRGRIVPRAPYLLCLWLPSIFIQGLYIADTDFFFFLPVDLKFTNALFIGYKPVI